MAYNMPHKEPTPIDTDKETAGAMSATLAAVSGADVNPEGDSNANPQSGATTQPTNPPTDDDDSNWHTVNIFHGLPSSAGVTSYIVNSVRSDRGINVNSENLPDLSQHARTGLEPITSYRFRIRERKFAEPEEDGCWSEMSTFRTITRKLPRPPMDIEIIKVDNGINITWKPHPDDQNINEYCVFLAVKPSKQREINIFPDKLAFIKVYGGPRHECIVKNTFLSAAHVDYSDRPAIIFHVAARNVKGLGPTNQVRWIQSSLEDLPSTSAQRKRAKPSDGGCQ